MTKMLALFFVILLTACSSIEYNGETRLIISGKIINSSENPIADQSVRILVYDPEYGNPDIISNGATDGSGNFKLIIPAPKDENNFIRVEINKYGHPYDLVTYDSIKQSDFTNYKLDLGLITLHPKKQLQP